MSIFSGLIGRFRYVRNSNGSHSYSIIKNNTSFINGIDPLELSLSHSTIASLITIRADYLSKAIFYIQDSNGNRIFDDPILDFINNPNPHQSKEDFLKQFEWFMCSYGWTYQLPHNSVLTGLPKYIYNLSPSRIELPNTIGDSILLKPSDIKKYYSNKFKYKDFKTTKSISFSDIIPFFDVSNGLSCEESSVLTSPNRLMSVNKEVSNVSLASDAENIIIQTNGREIVFSDEKGQGLGSSIPMTQEDKKNIHRMLNSKHLLKTGGNRTLTPSKPLSWVNMSIKLSDLGLNDSRETNSNIISQRFQVPNEIYKAFQKGDTFENQKQAEVGFVQNVIQPRADDIASSWTTSFGDIKRPIKASFEHLPSMQIIEETRAERALKITTSIRNLINAGLNEGQSIEFLNNLGINIDKK